MGRGVAGCHSPLAPRKGRGVGGEGLSLGVDGVVILRSRRRNSQEFGLPYLNSCEFSYTLANSATHDAWNNRMAEYKDREHYIPVRRHDLVNLLCADRGLDEAAAAQFRQLSELLAATFHFEYHRL